MQGYMFLKKVLKEIKKNKKLEMTDFIMSLSKKGIKTIVYQSEDDWLDIGHLKKITLKLRNLKEIKLKKSNSFLLVMEISQKGTLV